MKVAIAVHGRFHAFDLARGLDARGVLSQVATTYPRAVARRFLAPPIRLRCAPWLEAWRRLDKRLPFVPSCARGLPPAFGRFAARTLPDGADLLVGWSSATLEAVPAARARGMAVVIERGSTHILHQAEVLAAESARLGLDAAPTPAPVVERELAEYAEADAIAVPTRFAAETFVARGIPEARLIVNPYGIDTARFAALPRPAEPGPEPRILFVGQLGVRKGTAHLLGAFANLRGRARLDLVGPVEGGFERILAGRPTDGVTMPGPLSGARLLTAFAGADIFCLPSIEEGLALVLLQAMAAGLPVVATDASGAPDLVAPGGEGMVVPAGDEAALEAALAALIADPALRARMGAAARRRVAAGFGRDAYADRAVDAYRRLLRGRDAGPTTGRGE